MPFPGIEKLIGDLKKFDFDKEMVEIVSENTGKLGDLQREQMHEGKGVDGDWIRPLYSEDRYFKTPEAAKQYAEWKQRLDPNPLRPFDVPNLFINGYFHRSLFARVKGDEFTIDTNVELGDKVLEEHKNAEGLNEEKRMEFAETVTLPEISQRLLTKTGLAITEI